MTETNFTRVSEILKVDDSLGLVFGFAIVCTEDGEPYFDLQKDHVPDESMLKESTDYMLNSRLTKEMHEGDPDGLVVFAFPMTAEIAKALDIETPRTGLLIGMRPGPEAFAKYKSGEYSSFSIGGSYGENEEVS